MHVWVDGCVSVLSHVTVAERLSEHWAREICEAFGVRAVEKSTCISGTSVSLLDEEMHFLGGGECYTYGLVDCRIFLSVSRCRPC